MGRRALSIAAIVLWLGAGLAFGLFGVRAIRLERANAIGEARRLADTHVKDAVLYLPTAVSEALRRETASQYRIIDTDAGASASPTPPISSDDLLILNQAAFMERAGLPAEGSALLARLTSRVPLAPAVAVASLRAGALALARFDVDSATSLLGLASEAPTDWRDPEGLPIAASAWRLLAPIEAATGRVDALVRLLDASDDGDVVTIGRRVDLPELLLATAHDLDSYRDQLSDKIVDRLDMAEVRAERGQQIVETMGRRGVAVVHKRGLWIYVAVRAVEGPPAIHVTWIENVKWALARRTKLPLRLTITPRVGVPSLRAEPPLDALYVSHPDWEQTIATPVGLAVLAIGLGLYLIGGLFTIVWFVRNARASRMQADFVAAVSHEMKTPIAGIQAMAEMLADGRVPDPARAHVYAERIRAEASRLGAGVRNVLDAARIERDPSSVVHPVPVEPSVLVEDLASVMRPVLEGRGFRFTVATTPSPSPIPIDPDSFGSVISNLLDNAAKFSTETKEIDLEAGPVANGYRVTVADRGPGVPRDERAKIFDRFQRGEHARRMAVPGVGLGLHVARNLMKAHGGSISVADREGGGAVFVVEWPGGTS